MPNIITTREELDAVVDRFMEYDAFAFDTETKGEYRLDPRRNDCFWLQMCGPGLDVVTIPFGHPVGHRVGFYLEPKMCADGKVRRYKKPRWSEPPEQLTPAEVFGALKRLFFDPTKTKVGCNIKFDLETVSKYWGELPPGPYFDTQVADYLCNENHFQYRLDEHCKREFGFAWDKKIAARLEEQPFKVAALYTHYDATYTWLSYRRLLPRLREQRVMGVFRLEMDLLPALCAMETEGADVDIDALRALDRDLDEMLARLKTDLYRLVGHPWNFDSPKDKQHVFYGKRSEGGQGLKPWRFTAKRHEPSTDDAALKGYVGNPLVDAYREWQDVNKLSSTYVKAYLGTSEKKKAGSDDRNNAPPYNEETGRIHANFKQHGAKTGRFSCSEPNLQNIPRPDTELGQRIRGLFVAPEGYTLIVADWSQIEYRILAKFSNDTRLIQTFIDNVDFHTYVASLLLGKPMEEVTKVERTTSKNTNFATIYGAGVDKVAAMSGISVDDATAFREAHQRMLPKVYRYCRSVVKDCKRQRPPYVRTLLGRKRRLPEINWPGDDNWGRRSYAERQAVNTVIQGSAADLMKLAIVRLADLMPDDFRLLLTVHDELVMKVPDERVEEGVAVMREAMMGEEIASLLAPVPLVADIKAVKRWSDAKE